MVDWLLYFLLMLACLAAVGLNVLSLPGNWVMLALGTAWCWYQGWGRPDWRLLLLMLFVLLAAEVIELLGSVVGARTFGASKAASWAAIAGTMVGAVLGTFIPINFGLPGVGNLIGAIGGAFLAAWAVELIRQQPLGLATKAAMGAALGRGVGIMAKIGCGLLVWVLLGLTAFPW